jgi:alpha-beta hydrolase superfamily lysophospholipase
MRQPEERFFVTRDGTELFYRYWPALTGPGDRAIVLFHRGHEHSGRMQHVVDELDLGEFALFAWDARGHGLSPGERGFSPSLGTSVNDIDGFIRHIGVTFGIVPGNIAVVAQSVGSVLVATWVHDYAPPIRCMVLASPAFKVRLYVPLARPGLKLLHALRGNFYVNSYVKARYLTHDPERIASYHTDPLISRPIAANILLDLYAAAERVVADAAAIEVPTQLLISGSDWVVHRQPQLEFYRRLGSAIREKHVFPGFYHDTLGEKQRHLPIAKARAFILEMFAQPPQRRSLLAADRRGFSKDEFEELRLPLPAWSAKGMYYTVTRLGLRIGALLSQGIRLGFDSGFDSGSTLDYVYRNRAGGVTALGRLLDRSYLNSPGWRGIRVRKQHLQTLLQQAVERLHGAGRPVRIVDIAAGHGRYVLEALQSLDYDQILLRDYSETNVRQGNALIAEKGMQQRARFEHGDAFERTALTALTPRPTLAVVSGLYELFPDNAPLRESLTGLAAALEAGGYLVYTGQPWHPQLEMIARVLTSHRQGEPWVMRRRSQAELDQLVAAAGFEKIDQLTDDWGIFTVSLARRKSA